MQAQEKPKKGLLIAFVRAQRRIAGLWRPLTSVLSFISFTSILGSDKKSLYTGQTMEYTTRTVEIVEGRASRYSQLQTLIALVKPRTIIEIGTHRGNSAVAMCLEALKHRSKVHYVGFDVFETKDEDFHRRAFNGKGVPGKQFVHARLESICSHFSSFTFELIEGETCSTLHHRSMRADFVFIDGDHRVEVIKCDYEAVAKSTVIVFDDFYDPGSPQGHELIARFGCNQLVAGLEDVTILPLADSFPNSGPIRMAVKMSRSPLSDWFQP